MTVFRPIRTTQDHHDALKRISELIDLNPQGESPEADELEVLGVLIMFYEKDHWPKHKADPIATIKFHMDRLGLNQAQLARKAGIQSSHLSAVLNSRKPLSMNQCKKLAALFDVPIDRLIVNEFEARLSAH